MAVVCSSACGWSDAEQVLPAWFNDSHDEGPWQSPPSAVTTQSCLGTSKLPVRNQIVKIMLGQTLQVLYMIPFVMCAATARHQPDHHSANQARILLPDQLPELFEVERRKMLRPKQLHIQRLHSSLTHAGNAAGMCSMHEAQAEIEEVLQLCPSAEVM